MLSDTDRQMLEFFKERHLITKEEIASLTNGHARNGLKFNVQRLVDLGFVEKVESLGTCYVITQAGMRALRD